MKRFRAGVKKLLGVSATRRETKAGNPYFGGDIMMRWLLKCPCMTDKIGKGKYGQVIVI